MAMAARKIDPEPFMPERTILDEKIDHLKENVASLKADITRIDAKVDAISASLAEHRLETERSIGKLRNEMLASSTKMIVWMIGTMITASGAAFTAARFFSGT